MEGKPQRPLSAKEKELTERNIKSQEYNLTKLEVQKRKIQVSLDELPFVKDSFEKQLEKCQFEIDTTKLAVEQGRKTLERGVRDGK